MDIIWKESPLLCALIAAMFAAYNAFWGLVLYSCWISLP